MNKQWETRKQSQEETISQMYNTYNNDNLDAQKQRIQEKKDNEARQKIDDLKDQTSSYLEENTSSGVGVKGRTHPLYRTSNMIYGAREATDMHKPIQYHGQNGSFTKEFVGGMFRNHSLNCEKTRNNTIRDPSFGTNEWYDSGL